MHDDDPHARLMGLTAPRGAEARLLRLGCFDVRLEGLDGTLAEDLALRWGPFLETTRDEPAAAGLLVFDAGERPWLPPAEGPDPLYRLEARGPAETRAVVSHQFAVCADPDDSRRFRLGLGRGPELPGRLIENAVRFVAANLALDRGGFAMHAAGVLHGGKAFLYAGPSRSGKTTAVAASAPARSLGDDFALVIRDPDGFVAPALPFDGAERVRSGATRGTFPVAAIWRVYHAAEVRVERPSPRVAAASLLSCAAFPWALPERAGELLDHVQRFVEVGEFAHLHFARGSDLYSTVLAPADGAG